MAVPLFVFSSCDSDGIDARDAFIGAYSFVSEGTVTVYNTENDVRIMTLPLDVQGELVITKMREKDKVAITIADCAISATVSGNRLIIESFAIETTINEDQVEYTFSEASGILINNTLSWKSKVNAELSYQAMAGPMTAIGTDTVSVVATKK